LDGFLEVETRQMESLWLKAYATRGWGESFWIRVSMNGESGPFPSFFNYTLKFALKLWKNTENRNQGVG
jgi:hypothetical protein